MSRRSHAHATREVREVPVGNGNRSVKIAIKRPRTREDRDPSWDRNNPTSRMEQKKQRAARRANAR